MATREVTALLAQYLTSSPAQRVALQGAHPEIFCDEVLLEMQDAEQLMQETDAQVKDVHGCFSQVVTELDLPGLPGPREHSAIAPQALFAHNFNERLSTLFAAAWHAPLVTTQSSRKWYAASGVIQVLLSFMPIMDIMCVAENTCSSWRDFLRGDGASAFWIGCVQREFPTELGILVAAEGSKLFESDWRTIAMLVCSNDDTEDGGGGDE